MKRKLFDHILDIVFFIFLVIGSITAVNYFSTSEVFDANIVYVNNVKLPYTIQIEINNKVDEELKYYVELIYKKENLVIDKKKIECTGVCDLKLDIESVFFDKYEVVIDTKYESKSFRKTLEFNLEKPESKNKIALKKKYYFEDNASNVLINGKVFVEEPSPVILEIFSNNIEDSKQVVNLTCDDICDFNFSIKSNIILGNYTLNAYFPNDVLEKKFSVELESNKVSSLNVSNLDNLNDTVKVNLSDDKKDIVIVDMIGNSKVVEDVENELELPQGYEKVIIGDKREEADVVLKPKIDSIENLEDVENLSLNEVSKSFGFTDVDYNLSDNVSNGFELQTLNEDFNEVVDVEEKVFVNDNNRYYDLDDVSFNESLDIDNRKIVPGVYKKERIVRYEDGSKTIEEAFFAYGLISINTKKPLYRKGEDVEFLVVVLDKGGFLVSDADIVLNVINPLNETVVLSTENLDIIETENKGVYSANMKVDEIGKYEILAEVEQYDMIVDVKSFFNVVDDYEFDIIRDVPATIDPWQGSFVNKFKITDLKNYRGEYDLKEVFSSDFEVVDSDADEIVIENESTYLIWKNLHGDEELFYELQAPLKSPYLYYLGKAVIEYKDVNKNFYENRSWLLAIDPAAEVCNFESPCNCAAACANKAQAGDGTIDGCADGDQNYERVLSVRVTNLDGDYFGVGDTVRFCSEYKCESSSRIALAYKDASDANWVGASHLLIERTNCVNEIREYCQDVPLTNYVGEHHFRSLLKYQTGGAGTICYTGTYMDHDDVIIQVLDKVPANVVSWNLNNGTSTGNNLNVIRGSVVNSTTIWDKPLQYSQIRHNSDGVYKWYDVTSFADNSSFYSFDTSDLTFVPDKGVVTINLVRSWDEYFNITGDTVGTRNFNVLGEVEINETNLFPNVGYAGISTNISCQVTDKNVNVAYDNIQVDFYKDGALMGSSLTNSTGWARYGFTENIIGEYNISCKVEDDLSKYVVASGNNEGIRKLIVRVAGADIVPPNVTNLTITNTVFSVGGITTIGAEVVDDISVGDVELKVLLPNGTLVTVPMINTVGNIYSVDFVYTTLDGNYKYYIYAEDSSGNPTFSSTRNFEVTGVRTFVGIQASSNVFKLGQKLDLVPFTRLNTVSSTLYGEIGDVGEIYYSFDADNGGWTHGGARDEWEWGTANDPAPFDSCNSGRCWGTDLNANYNNNADQWVSSPSIDFTGRTNVVVNFWRVLDVQQGTGNDRAYFESFDGSWNVLFEDSDGAGGGDLARGFSTFYPSEVEGVSDGRFRFRITSDGITTDNGWLFDDFNITFTPREDWDKSWYEISSSFGADLQKLTAIKIEVNVTSYDSSGSDALGTASPDLEFQVFDGSSYTDSFKCHLDGAKSYPYKCVIVVKSQKYLDAWKTASNRRVRFRAIDLDHNDAIDWTDIKREFVTPSIIENNGIGMMSAYLLAQFINSTGGVVQTLNFAPISLNPGEGRNLSDFWDYDISGNFQLGEYSAYIALTDAFGNVLQNEDDSTYINDSYKFNISSLIINPVRPLWGSQEEESLKLELNLDTTSYGSGGWCGFSLNGKPNVTMNQLTLIHYDYDLGNVVDGSNEVIFYCNDTDGDMVNTGIIGFNVSQNPRISFVAPTVANGSTILVPNTYINVSIDDASNTSGYIDFNYSLVGYWNFENVTGNNVEDVSASSYTGVLSSGARTGIANYTRGQYGVFDGIDDAMIIQNSKDLQGFDEMTIEAWVKTGDVLGSYGYVLAKRDNTNYSYGLAYDTTSGDFWRFYVNDYFTDYVEAPLVKNKWTHLAGVYSKTNLSIYVDGVLIDSKNFNDSMELTDDIDVVVGGRRNFQNTGMRWPFVGNIDEVKLWKRALGVSEIKASYNSKINSLYHNFTLLKNGNYDFYACASDAFGNMNCTENREITINKDLGTFIVDSPAINAKYSVQDIIYFNATSSLQQEEVWLAYSNRTVLNLTNVTNLKWSALETLDTGNYNVSFYAKDYIGNILEVNDIIFLVLPDKHIVVTKGIKALSDDSYKIDMELVNLGRWTNHSYLDFNDELFNSYLMSISPNVTEISSSLGFKGEQYVFKVVLNLNNNQSNFYYNNASNDYKLGNNFVIGIE